MNEVLNFIKRLRRCADEHRKDMQYGGHERITPLCLELANFLEREYNIKDEEE